MPLFEKGPDFVRTPFMKNQYLRSTRDLKFESYMFAEGGIPPETIDGNAGQKVLQPGTVLAVITAVGVDQGKVGVYDTTATDGRQTTANIVGLNETFLPWQLMEGDREVSVLYEGAVKQAWCYQYTAGVRAALTNTVRDAIVALPGLAILFR